MQRTGIRLMVACTQQMDSSPMAKANHYIREARRKGKSPKKVSAQWTDSGLMAVLQHMVKPSFDVEHQMTTYLQATSTQWTDHGLMVVLQWTAMPRVVASWQTNLSPQAIRA